MRVAYFGPAQQSAASAYDHALLPDLAHEIELERFVESGALSRVYPMPILPTFEETAFAERHAEVPFDLSLYQIGDHPAYRFVWEALRRRPGVVTLHSLNLHQLFGRRPADPTYEQMMTEGYGQAGQALAKCRGSAIQSPLDGAAMPLGWIVASQGLGVVVHTHEAGALLQERLPALPVAVIGRPLPPGLPLAPEVHATIRQRLGLRPEGLIVTSFGLLPLNRRERLTRAYGRLLRDHPEAILVIAAEDRLDAVLWEEVLRSHRLLGAARVLDVGESVAALAEIIAVSDMALYLPIPGRGEMSETPLRLMAAAKATLLPACRGPAEFPQDCCAHVDPGPPEEDLLWAYLHLLMDHPEMRQEMGENARRYVTENHAPTVAARAYSQLLAEIQQLLEQRRYFILSEEERSAPPETAESSPVAPGPEESSLPTEDLEEAGEIDVERIIQEIRLRIGEEYLTSEPPFPTFAGYRPPPATCSAEDEEMCQGLGEANQTWELVRPPAQAERILPRPKGAALGQIFSYLEEVAHHQTRFNASVVRTLNQMVAKLFDPARDVELTSLRHQMEALYKRLVELEKRLQEASGDQDACE